MKLLRCLASIFLLAVAPAWAPAQIVPAPYECVTVRSGGAEGITYISSTSSQMPLKSSPFTATDFALACSGQPAVQVTTAQTPWMASLPADSAAKWIGADANRSPFSLLFCQSFQVAPCNVQGATLQFWFAVDDVLGDPAGPNPVGVYLNGQPVPGFSGGSYSSQTYLFDGNVTALLQPGANQLQVYVRDAGATVSGVIYSARICYLPCHDRERLRIRSGNGLPNGLDSQITCVVGQTQQPIKATAITPVTDPLLAAAFNGPPAVIVSPALQWCPTLAVDPLAKWIAGDPLRLPKSTLFCHRFPVTSCAIQSASLDFRFSISDELGDGGPPNNLGLWLNGQPVPLSYANGNGGSACDQAFTASVGSLLVPNAINTLYVYDCHSGSTATGVLYSALLDIVPCANIEQIVLRSSQGSGIRYLAGPPGIPLQPVAFGTSDFNLAASGPLAVAVPPTASWLQAMPNDPQAQWMSTSATRGPGSALYCHPFTVNTCPSNIKTVKLDITFAADDRLGDDPAWGPARNPLGLYVNGFAVPGSGPLGNYGTATTFSAAIPATWIHSGQNALYLYDRDKGIEVSGVFYSAKITIVPCRPYIIYGDGCGLQVPVARVTTYPEVGGSLEFKVLGAAPNALGVTFVGVSDAMWSGLRLPFDLGMIGAPGCKVLASLDATLAQLQTNGEGEAGFKTRIPNAPAFVNATVFSQTVVLDAAANALGLSMSAGLAVTIQQPGVR